MDFLFGFCRLFFISGNCSCFVSICMRVFFEMVLECMRMFFRWLLSWCCRLSVCLSFWLFINLCLSKCCFSGIYLVVICGFGEMVLEDICKIFLNLMELEEV